MEYASPHKKIGGFRFSLVDMQKNKQGNFDQNLIVLLFSVLTITVRPIILL